MSKHEKFGLGFIGIAVAVGLWLMFVLGFMQGRQSGLVDGFTRARMDAANAGAGYWHSDPKTGEQ